MTEKEKTEKAPNAAEKPEERPATQQAAGFSEALTLYAGWKDQVLGSRMELG